MTLRRKQSSYFRCATRVSISLAFMPTLLSVSGCGSGGQSTARVTTPGQYASSQTTTASVAPSSATSSGSPSVPARLSKIASIVRADYATGLTVDEATQSQACAERHLSGCSPPNQGHAEQCLKTRVVSGRYLLGHDKLGYGADREPIPLHGAIVPPEVVLAPSRNKRGAVDTACYTKDGGYIALSVDQHQHIFDYTDFFG